MRLVIDGHRLTANRTGVGRCLESLLAEWAETGWPLPETILAVRDEEGLARVPRSAGLQTVVVGKNRPEGLIWAVLGLGQLLRKDDLLFAPTNLIPPMWRGRSVPIIFDTLPLAVPQTFTLKVRLQFGWRYERAARKAWRIIVPSQATARDVTLFHGIPADRIQVIYPGIEPAFQPLPPEGPQVQRARQAVGIGQAPYFLFVGKRSKRRNIPAILDAFASHRESSPEYRLVFVGPEDADGLPGASSGVVAAGHVDERVLRGLLAGAIALLYPSDYEGFGLPVVEAMACGCPVVTLRNSALVESGGEAAYYLPRADMASLLEAMRRLSTEPDLRARHIAEGLIQAARFDRRTFGNEVREVLRLAARA